MFILGLVVIYIYAVISFALIPNYFNPERDEFCESVFECFITITRLGLLDTLGLVCSICHSLKLHLYYLEMGNSEIFNYHDTSEAEIVCPSHTPLIEPSNRKKLQLFVKINVLIRKIPCHLRMVFHVVVGMLK